MIFISATKFNFKLLAADSLNNTSNDHRKYYPTYIKMIGFS